MVLKTGEEVGHYLATVRGQKGLTLDNLIERMGHVCTRGTINQIEKNYHQRKDGGPMRPKVDIVDAWADALGLSRNEMRQMFGHPADPTELNYDGTTKEFQNSVARYARLSETSQEYFQKIVKATLDYLIEIDERPEPAGKKRGAKKRSSEIPTMTLDQVKSFHDSRQETTKKGPKALE